MTAVDRISFPTGVSAVVVGAAPDAFGDDLVARLDLPAPHGTLVVNGTTQTLAPELAGRVEDLIVNGVAPVVRAGGLTVLTGATDAGIFSLLGRALEGHRAPLVGVAPRSLVTWPGQPDGGAQGRERLEPHHSHFVVVDGEEWGDETAALLALAAALGARAPSVAVLFGGGAVARREAVGHVRAGRPLVVVAGSGRLADELVGSVRAPMPPDDAELAEMAAGDVVVVDVEDGAEALADALRDALASR